MSIKTAYSEKRDIELAVGDLKSQISIINPKMIIYFASSQYEPNAVAKRMQDQFSDIKVIGCTTAGELVGDKVLKKSIVAMGFDSGSLDDVEIGVVENIKNEDNVYKVFNKFEKHFNVKMKNLSHTDYVGIVLIDGLSMSEEKVMDSIGNKTMVYFIGGSAGDDMTFKGTYIFADGKAYTNAALLALLKPKKSFSFIKTQSFCRKERILEPTKVDEETRTVYEFNGKPAVDAYIEAINKTIDEAPNYFAMNPTGVIMPDNEIFVRTPQKFNDDKSITFYCNIKEGIPLSLLEATNIVEDTKKALEEKKKEVKSISGIINFHCCFRTLILENQNLTKEYGKLFKGINTIGFSTYGEEFIGHMNETSTMLVFE